MLVVLHITHILTQLYIAYTTNNMKQNKLYQQCREEAKKIIRDKYLLKFNTQYVGLYQDEINQLTAELYAQKFADWTQPVKQNETWYIRIGKKWEESKTFTPIGTTAQLHEKFVEENKGGDDE